MWRSVLRNATCVLRLLSLSSSSAPPFTILTVHWQTTVKLCGSRQPTFRCHAFFFFSWTLFSFHEDTGWPVEVACGAGIMVPLITYLTKGPYLWRLVYSKITSRGDAYQTGSFHQVSFFVDCPSLFKARTVWGHCSSHTILVHESCKHTEDWWWGCS